MKPEAPESILARIMARIRAGGGQPEEGPTEDDADLATPAAADPVPYPKWPEPPVPKPLPSIEGPPYHVNDLLGFDDDVLIDNAYRRLLGRPPTAEEAAAGRRDLAGGRSSQLEVVWELRQSAEGRRRGARVRGLWRYWIPALRRRLPPLGYLLDLVRGLVTLPRKVDARWVEDDKIRRRTVRLAIRAAEDRRAAEDALRQTTDELNRALGQVNRAVAALSERLRVLEGQQGQDDTVDYLFTQLSAARSLGAQTDDLESDLEELASRVTVIEALSAGDAGAADSREVTRESRGEARGGNPKPDLRVLAPK